MTGTEPVEDAMADAATVDMTENKTARSTIVGNITSDVYAAAAECVDAVLKQRASVKSAIFNSPFPVSQYAQCICRID